MDENEEAEHLLLPPRRRFRPVLIIGAIALVALIVGGSIFTFTRLTDTGGLLGSAPAPTLTPGSNQFYFSVSPSWGTITVDGHVLSPVPEPGTGQPPLTLSFGTHQVVWQVAPFSTMRCLIFLPFRYSVQSCVNSNTPLTLQESGTHSISAYLVNFSLSLSSLTSSQFNAMTKAIRSALQSIQGTEILQAGEHFAHTHSASTNISIDASPNSLQATLNYLLIASYNTQGAYGACVAGGLIDQPDSCANQGQSCVSFCPITESGSPWTNHWNVFALISPDWTYSIPTGNHEPVLQGQPDPAAGDNAFLVALSIQWDGSNWQVTFYHSKNVDTSEVGNPACDAVQYTIGQDPRFLSVVGSSQNLYWKFISGSNAAAGCVAEAFLETPAGTAPSSHPIASCLYRFGVTLALDTEAHRSWPFLLQASSYEQGIAQQIVAQTR